MALTSERSTLQYWNEVGGVSPLGDSYLWESKGFGQSFVAENLYLDAEIAISSFPVHAAADDLDLSIYLIRLDAASPDLARGGEVLEQSISFTVERTILGDKESYRRVNFSNSVPLEIGGFYAVVASAWGLKDSQSSYGSLGFTFGNFYDSGSFISWDFANSQATIEPDYRDAAFSIGFYGAPVNQSDDPLTGRLVVSLAGRKNIVLTPEEDKVLFITPGEFGIQKADRIIDFDAQGGDVLALSETALPGIDSSTLKIAKSSTKLRSALKSTSELVYDSQKGQVYYNENGAKAGSGAGGGLFASLGKRTYLDSDSFELITQSEDPFV
jgi:hypothetical protein